MIPAMHFGWRFYQVHRRTALGQTSSRSLRQKVCHWRMPSSQKAASGEEESLILHNIRANNTLTIFFSQRIYPFQDFLEIVVCFPVPIRRVAFFSKYLLQSFNCYSHLWEEVKYKCQLHDGHKGWEGNLQVDQITSKGSATLPRKYVRSWDVATVGIKLPALFNTKYLAAIPLMRSSEERHTVNQSTVHF